jgi:hypothetical protein
MARRADGDCDLVRRLRDIAWSRSTETASRNASGIASGDTGMLVLGFMANNSENLDISEFGLALRLGTVYRARLQIILSSALFS